jgi:hypothetical protein
MKKALQLLLKQQEEKPMLKKLKKSLKQLKEKMLWM